MSQHKTEILHLQALLANKTITRRDFMGRAAALGLTTALATSLASGAAKAAAGQARPIRSIRRRCRSSC